VINVHPSLIPHSVGGFYGLKVHEEALRYGVKVTGATDHFVNQITTAADSFAKGGFSRIGRTPKRCKGG
jgi:folate-dependent phosphoribosylglycinamide formyltransferase PurN